MGSGYGGSCANDDILTEGPLAGVVGKAWSDTLTGLHEDGFDVLLALVALHVAAIAFYRLYAGEDLVRPMLTGRKPGTGPAPRLARAWLALVALAASTAAVWTLVGLA